MTWLCMVLVVGWLAGCNSSPPQPAPEHRVATPMSMPPPPVQLPFHHHKDHVPYEEQFPPSEVQPPEDEARKTEIYNRLAEIRQRFEERQKDGH